MWNKVLYLLDNLESFPLSSFSKQQNGELGNDLGVPMRLFFIFESTNEVVKLWIHLVLH